MSSYKFYFYDFQLYNGKILPNLQFYNRASTHVKRYQRRPGMKHMFSPAEPNITDN